MADALTIRPVTAADRPALRAATIELQEYERRHHDTRLPGEQIADDYLDWMWRRSASDGVILVAEIDGVFAGFVAGWVEHANNIAETPESNHFGLISNICVMPEFRGRRLAAALIGAIEAYLRRSGVARLRVNALAANEAAGRSYQHAGFAPYEILHEKRIGPDEEG
jgi:ribosomal protein S18 acetylase RimI-like enzyme